MVGFTSYTGTDGSGDDFITHAKNILEFLGGTGTVNGGEVNITGIGLYQLIGYSINVIGMVLLFVAIIRLTKHGKQQQMFRYHSPLATVFYFVSGCFLLSYANLFQLLSSTLFGTDLSPSPILAYYTNNIDGASTETALQYILYACLIVIGFLAVVRGSIAMIRLGEGQGQQNEVTKSLVHIGSGAIALNAHQILSFFGIWT